MVRAWGGVGGVGARYGRVRTGWGVGESRRRVIMGIVDGSMGIGGMGMGNAGDRGDIYVILENPLSLSLLTLR